MVLQASDNNRSTTMLDLFKSAVREYGMPSRVRGDLGGENIDVMTYIIMKNGTHRASFIWDSWVNWLVLCNPAYQTADTSFWLSVPCTTRRLNICEWNLELNLFDAGAHSSHASNIDICLILTIHITYGFYTFFFSLQLTRIVVISSWSGTATRSTVSIQIWKVQW